MCRLLFEDDKHFMHLYNAVNDQVLTLEEATADVKVALWDTADPNLFLLSDDGKMLSIYLYMPTSLDGPSTLAAPISTVTRHTSCHMYILVMCSPLALVSMTP